MSLQNASSSNQSCSVPLYVGRLVLDWPTPTTNTIPFAAGPPAPVYRPRTRSRRFWRAAPAPVRTAEDDSLTAQVSPAPMSKPCTAIRRRASTPASYQVLPLAAIHRAQPL